ncbi:MAG: hypothetical protein U1F37_07770 [Alphaproteobacteria bacterium]
MHRDYAIRPLTGALVEKSFPFAQALGIRDLARWRAFVASYVGSPDSGAIAAETQHGYVAGLLFYQANRHDQGGAALVCDPFVVADMPRYATPAKALLEAADDLALERGCKWVRVVLPATGDPLNAEAVGCEGALFRAGYALESLSFRRRRSLPAGKMRIPAPAKQACRPRTSAR